MDRGNSYTDLRERERESEKRQGRGEARKREKKDRYMGVREGDTNAHIHYAKRVETFTRTCISVYRISVVIRPTSATPSRRGWSRLQLACFKDISAGYQLDYSSPKRLYTPEPPCRRYPAPPRPNLPRPAILPLQPPRIFTDSNWFRDCA